LSPGRNGPRRCVPLIDAIQPALVGGTPRALLNSTPPPGTDPARGRGPSAEWCRQRRCAVHDGDVETGPVERRLPSAQLTITWSHGVQPLVGGGNGDRAPPASCPAATAAGNDRALPLPVRRRDKFPLPCYPFRVEAVWRPGRLMVNERPVDAAGPPPRTRETRIAVCRPVVRRGEGDEAEASTVAG